MPEDLARLSQYRGVTWDKKAKKWRARITIQGRTVHLGFFDDEVQAARAFDDFAYHKLRWSLSYLNLPEERK